MNEKIMKSIKIIGYSGHSYVCIDTHLKNSGIVSGYFDIEKKNKNPYNLKYYGKEQEVTSNDSLFISIGNNFLREEIYFKLEKKGNLITNIIDSSCIISKSVKLSHQIFIGPNAVINSNSKIEKGCIINTGSIIEHECEINSFSHISPGSVLCGNVMIGSRTIIGANSVIKQGVKIGDDVIIGAGAVIITDIPNNVTVVGNPGRIINRKFY